VFPNPSSRSSFSLLLCDNRNIILVEKKSTAPASGRTLLRWQLMKLNDRAMRSFPMRIVTEEDGWYDSKIGRRLLYIPNA